MGRPLARGGGGERVGQGNRRGRGGGFTVSTSKSTVSIIGTTQQDLSFPPVNFVRWREFCRRRGPQTFGKFDSHISKIQKLNRKIRCRSIVSSIHRKLRYDIRYVCPHSQYGVQRLQLSRSARRRALLDRIARHRKIEQVIAAFKLETLLVGQVEHTDKVERDRYS